jgi:hypothetical protein
MGAAGCRRLELSLHFDLMADARTLPLAPKWLKSSVERLSGKSLEVSEHPYGVTLKATKRCLWDRFVASW